MRVMTETEETILRAFGNKRVHLMPSENQIDLLHEAIKNYAGEPYKPPKKTVEAKIVDLLKLHSPGSEWDIKTIQRHLYFFNQKKYSTSHISRCLKKLAEKNLIEKIGHGHYRKAA